MDSRGGPLSALSRKFHVPIKMISLHGRQRANQFLWNRMGSSPTRRGGRVLPRSAAYAASPTTSGPSATTRSSVSVWTSTEQRSLANVMLMFELPPQACFCSLFVEGITVPYRDGSTIVTILLVSPRL